MIDREKVREILRSPGKKKLQYLLVGVLLAAILLIYLSTFRTGRKPQEGGTGTLGADAGTGGPRGKAGRILSKVAGAGRWMSSSITNPAQRLGPGDERAEQVFDQRKRGEFFFDAEREPGHRDGQGGERHLCLHHQGDPTGGAAGYWSSLRGGDIGSPGEAVRGGATFWQMRG